MKNLMHSFFAVILLVLIMSFQTYAQISFKIGGGLGYSLPTGDYSGTTIDFYNGTKYGMESGFNLHAKARATFVILSGFGEIGYTSFSGNGESQPGQGSVDVSHKIFSIKLGPELPISIPMTPVTAYLQGFASYNAISGNVEFKGVADVPTGKYDIASASRIGLGLGIGAIFSLGGFDLDANIQYHFINLAGQEYKLENVTSHDRLDNYTSLNDGKDPSYENGSSSHFIGNDRAIDALEFKLSILFGI